MKHAIKRLLASFGYELRRIRPPAQLPLGRDPFVDMQKLLAGQNGPLIFDVGANVGQSIENFRQHFKDPVIHAFEPGGEAFPELRRRTAGLPNLHLNNLALGARAGKQDFFESVTGTELNSMLEPSTEIWGGGGVKRKSQVQVSTVDDYCREQAIDHINILKTDTQGFDFEVIKGAAGMFRKKAVQLVFMEILFSDMYHGQARMDQIFGYLMDQGFVLVSFYPFYYWGNKASWTEGVFAQPDYRPAAGA